MRTHVFLSSFAPSQFNITGTLKPWTIIDILHKISVPTLVTNGMQDETQDICVAPFFEKIPKTKWAQFNGSHIGWLENEKVRYLKNVGEFLKD
jgi:pimeloyl-ACP methyl ester carboxylesterase